MDKKAEKIRAVAPEVLRRQPVKAKGRRGAPTPAEMNLLGSAFKSGVGVTLKHSRGCTQPAELTLAWELSERGWFTTPTKPEVKDDTRHWTFFLTKAGTETYRRELETYI